mmetsp:Transcript_1298/g.2815  ORF Transcript_1298/g.2815 Transcript_1298/m.2815 type:complete len:161 (+) Transcript_1298:20-502(+)
MFVQRTVYFLHLLQIIVENRGGRKGVPFPASHIKRTDSEDQFEMASKAAEVRDFLMFRRILSGLMAVPQKETLLVGAETRRVVESIFRGQAEEIAIQPEWDTLLRLSNKCTFFFESSNVAAFQAHTVHRCSDKGNLATKNKSNYINSMEEVEGDIFGFEI